MKKGETDGEVGFVRLSEFTTYLQHKRDAVSVGYGRWTSEV